MTAAKGWMGTILLSVLVAALPAAAQVVKGIAPFQSYGAGSIDTVNLVDLNLHLHIPIIANKGRGLPFDYSLDFDSTIWVPVVVNGLTTWEPAAGPWGWHANSSGDPGSVTYETVQEICQSQSGVQYWTLYENFVWTDATGVAHRFLVATDTPNNCNPSGSSTTGMAVDGSGYTIAVTNYDQVKIVSPAGVVYNPAPPGSLNGSSPAVEDANGNEITQSATSGYRTWIDTLGNPVSETDTAAGPTNVNYTGPGGSENVTVQYTAQTVTSNGLVCESGSQPINYNAGTQELPTAIVFPDGSGYHMTYDSAGALTSLQLPTGDVIHYAHAYGGASDAINCVDGSWYTMQRSTRDGSAEWTYTRVPSWASIYALWTSTATAAGGAADNTVLYSKQGYETERDVFAGSTPVETDITCYSGNTTDCRDYDPAEYLYAPSETAVTRTLGAAGGSARTSEVVTDYNQYQLPTEEDDYGFGAGTPGPLLRRVVTTYANLGNVQDKPAEVTVDSGPSTAVVSQTVFQYDQGTPAATSAAQHLTVTGSRGNLTEADAYSSASSHLTQSFTYFDTGAVDTATAVNGAQTQYQYGSASCGYAFPTEVLNPDGTNQQTSWNCAGAVPAAVIDTNGQTTDYYYDDISTGEWQWRPSTVTGPDGTRQTTFAENWMESALTFNGGASTDDTVTCYNSDGLPYLQQRRQAPGAQNLETTESVFDALGRLTETAAPAVTGFCTAPSNPVAAKTWQYDGQSRPIQVTDAGGGTVTYAYNQNDVLITLGPAPAGEHAKSRQLEYDALGRVASVCEVTGAGDATTCGQTNGGTGYFTQYTRDAAGRLTSTSEASSAATQTRSFSVDWLGRMLSEANPETVGVAANYVYDADSACGTGANDVGARVARQDAAGNVTCYLHDSMGRVTGETHPTIASGFLTPPNAYFVYGAGHSVGGSTMQNAAGRLAEAYTASGSTLETDEGFSYAADGRLAGTYESTAHDGGFYYWVGDTYAANGTLTQMQNNFGLPTITYALDGEGRWSTVSASSGQNSVVTGTQYNIFGEPTEVDLGSGDNDVYGYDASLGRMTGYTFDVSTGALAATLTWNQNGTLGNLTATDTLPGGDGANTQNCGYGYDDLARLASVNCGAGWAQTFTIDAFGNMKTDGSQGFSATFNLATNQVSDLGVTYDADGDATGDPQHSFAWDANQRPVTIDGAPVVYDALGNMVEKYQNGAWDQLVRGPQGNLIEASSATVIEAEVPLPGGGDAVYNASGLEYYRHADWEGSARVGSTSTQGVAYDQAFSPYGEVEAGGNTIDRQWAGINDGVSGDLYDAEAREFEDVAGRWSAPDPAGLDAFDPSDPQSLNRYAYTEDTPLLSTDPSGELSWQTVAGSVGSGAGFLVNPYVGLAVGIGWALDSLFGGSSAPAINTARAPATATVRDYDGVNWNGALQGEVDGMPVGMSVPEAMPFDFGGGSDSSCDFGPCGADATAALGFGPPSSNSGWSGTPPLDAQGLTELAVGFHALLDPLEKTAASVALVGAAAASVAVHVGIAVGSVVAGCVDPAAPISCPGGILVATATIPGTAASAYGLWVVTTKGVPAIWGAK